MNTVVNRIYTVDQINRGLRATVRELTESLGHSLGISGTSPTNGIIMGGLLASGVAGQMYSSVTKGTAILPSARALPIGNALYCYLADDETSNPAALLHSDGDATLDRYDAVTIKVSSVTDTLENASTYPTGTVTPQVNIQRGCQVTFSVIEGTPAATPLYPVIPSDERLLAFVLVPSGLTAGGGGMASATYEDWRAVRRFDELRNAGPHDVANVLQSFDAYRASSLPAGAVTLATLTWYMDGAEQWWAMRRTNPLAGDDTSNMYPMMIPGGREWDVFVPFSSGGVSVLFGTDLWVGDDAVEVQVLRTGTGSVESIVYGKSFPLAARGLQILDVTFHWEVVVGFDGVITADSLVFGVGDNLGNFTDLSAGGVSMALGVAGVKSQNLTPTGTPVLAANQFVRLAASINIDGTGTVGQVRLRGANIKVREGRA